MRFDGHDSLELPYRRLGHTQYIYLLVEYIPDILRCLITDSHRIGRIRPYDTITEGYILTCHFWSLTPYSGLYSKNIIVSSEETVFNQDILTAGDIYTVRTLSMTYTMDIVDMHILALIEGNLPHLCMHYVDSFEINVAAISFDTDGSTRVTHICQELSAKGTASAYSYVFDICAIEATKHKCSGLQIICLVTLQLILLMLIDSRSEPLDVRIVPIRNISFLRISKDIKVIVVSTSVGIISSGPDIVLSWLGDIESDFIPGYFRNNIES